MLINPTVGIEVISPNSEKRDRGEKLKTYKSIPTVHRRHSRSNPSTCFFDIVSMQDVASEASFVTATLAAQPEHEMGLCSRRSHFEPAFSFAHGLIIDLFKAKCVDIEVEGFVLVTDSYADGAEFCEHTYLLCVDHQ